MTFLYRGVSKKKDSTLNGQLSPNGSQPQITPLHDGKIKYDGTFTYGESEDNAVRAHHIETGLYGGCFVSATKNETRAAFFATSNYSEQGWVYVLDPSLFKKYGVNSKEFPDSLYPDEEEISIRAADCGPITPEVIVEKYEVDCNVNKGESLAKERNYHLQ